MQRRRAGGAGAKPSFLAWFAYPDCRLRALKPAMLQCCMLGGRRRCCGRREAGAADTQRGEGNVTTCCSPSHSALCAPRNSKPALEVCACAEFLPLSAQVYAPPPLLPPRARVDARTCRNTHASSSLTGALLLTLDQLAPAPAFADVDRVCCCCCRWAPPARLSSLARHRRGLLKYPPLTPPARWRRRPVVGLRARC